MRLPRFLPDCFAVLIVIGLGMVIGPEYALAQRPLGIDVSGYQGSYQSPPTHITWTSVKSDGIAFAWAKATEGITIVDPDYTYNAGNAKSAGVPIGAYHFARPELNTGTAGADAEAAYFWSTAGGYIIADGKSIVPALDYETAPGGTQAAAESWINEWCNDVANNAKAQGAAARPVIYSDGSIAADWMGATNTQWALWMASPNGENPQTGAPNEISPWSVWTFWQYGGAVISGITGDVDEDVFNGSALTLTNYHVSPLGINISSQPASVAVPPGSSVTFSVTATGSGTLSYQWKINGTNIFGANTNHYSINSAQVANIGNYSVMVTDSIATNQSASASLSIMEPLTNAPGSIVAPVGIINWWPADFNTLDILGGENGTPLGLLTYVAGEQNMAFHFDGSTTVISNGTASLLSSAWTACMWVNRLNTPQSSSVLLGDNTDNLKLEQSGGAHEVGVSVAGEGDFIFSPAYSVPTNTWTHLAFVGTSSNTTLYANGVLQGSLTNHFELPRGYIGATYNTTNSSYVDFMLGSLDNIMTFNVALSAAQINAIYSAGSAGLVCVPEITGMALNGSNQCAINLAGQTGKFYSIYSSTNLTNWTLIENDLLNTQGTNQFIDTNAATNGQKYYRISQTY